MTTTPDLITRLRGWPNLPGLNLDKDLMHEAADELERMYRKLHEGTLHELICNGNHSERVGKAGMICNCTLGKEIQAQRHELERLRAQVDGLRTLPTGWRVADEVTMSYLRWVAHVMGGIEPANHDANLHSRALNDLRRAMHRMDNCPVPPAEHLWPATSADPAQQAEPASELAAALGWPSGISEPAPWSELLREVARLRVAQQAEAHCHMPNCPHGAECVHAKTAPSLTVGEREAAAKAIYALFDGAADQPWVEGGNSFKRDDARRLCLRCPPSLPRRQSRRRSTATRRRGRPTSLTGPTAFLATTPLPACTRAATARYGTYASIAGQLSATMC
jgi:hypothetical protein